MNFLIHWKCHSLWWFGMPEFRGFPLSRYKNGTLACSFPFGMLRILILNKSFRSLENDSNVKKKNKNQFKKQLRSTNRITDASALNCCLEIISRYAWIIINMLPMSIQYLRSCCEGFLLFCFVLLCDIVRLRCYSYNRKKPRNQSCFLLT